MWRFPSFFGFVTDMGQLGGERRGTRDEKVHGDVSLSQWLFLDIFKGLTKSLFLAPR